MRARTARSGPSRWMVINPAMPHMVGSNDPRKEFEMVPDHGGHGGAALIRRAAGRRKRGGTATVGRGAVRAGRLLAELFEIRRDVVPAARPVIAHRGVALVAP